MPKRRTRQESSRNNPKKEDQPKGIFLFTNRHVFRHKPSKQKVAKAHRQVQCCVCTCHSKTTRYVGKTNLRLAVQRSILAMTEEEERRICNYCRKAISKKQPLLSPTQLPVFRTDDPTIRQFGLYATTTFKKGDPICPFFGFCYQSSEDVPDQGKDKAFKKSPSEIVDPSDTNCLAQFANHYIHGLINTNAKMERIVDEKGKTTLRLVATKKIKAGHEIFWNYRSCSTKHFVKRWQLMTSNKGCEGYLGDKVLFRDNSKELKRMMNQIQY